MKNASRMLIPVILAALAHTAEANPAHEPAIGGDIGSDTCCASDDQHAATYGELLEDMARKSAFRAAQRQGADHTMEAISELAARWLEMPEGATRVWDQRPRSAHSARVAVRNAQRSLWRTQRRHERIAAAQSHDPATPANQLSAVELRQLVHTVDLRDRDLVLYSAQGMTSPEIARACGLSPAAVRQRLSRVRRELRRQLQD